jgi:hypothetical protein
MRNPRYPVLYAAAVAPAAPAHAQFAKPEDAVNCRQSAFALTGSHMSRFNGQLKSGRPDMLAIQPSAARVQTLAPLPFEAFTPGSKSAAGSKARQEVW